MSASPISGQRFEDRDAGAFYFTSLDHERLIQRTKSVQDDTPCLLGRRSRLMYYCSTDDPF
ncbi:MAG: hypothetical protein ACREX9_05375 [Gammaproteobacteria bacterium]